jgi:hypothetical protein
VKMFLVLLPAVCLYSVLTACNRQSPSGTMLSPADQKTVLSFSEPATDNLLEGLKSGDYEAFSQDFSEEMLEALPQEEFEQWKKDRDARLGWYLRREVEGMVMRSDGTYTVIYQAYFAFNDNVLLRVVFEADPPHRIRSLWFDK